MIQPPSFCGECLRYKAKNKKVGWCKFHHVSREYQGIIKFPDEPVCQPFLEYWQERQIFQANHPALSRQS